METDIVHVLNAGADLPILVQIQLSVDLNHCAEVYDVPVPEIGCSHRQVDACLLPRGHILADNLFKLQSLKGQTSPFASLTPAIALDCIFPGISLITSFLMRREGIIGLQDKHTEIERVGLVNLIVSLIGMTLIVHSCQVEFDIKVLLQVDSNIPEAREGCVHLSIDEVGDAAERVIMPGSSFMDHQPQLLQLS